MAVLRVEDMDRMRKKDPGSGSQDFGFTMLKCNNQKVLSALFKMNDVWKEL